MRGDDRKQDGMWSYLSSEQRTSADHPLRPIRAMVNSVLRDLSPAFSRIYSSQARPSMLG